MRRRQEKIARHKAKRNAKRRALRDAPNYEQFLRCATAVKRWQAKRADAVAAVLPEAQAEYAATEARLAQERREARRAEKRWAVRIDGRWFLTYRGHAARVALLPLLLIAALIVAISHPVALTATVFALPVLNPFVGSVLALTGQFPVTHYGAKADGLDASAAANTAAFTTAIAAASAIGSGDVIVPRGATATPYMVNGGVILLLTKVQIVGVGRPVIKLVGGANIKSEVFRAAAGKSGWGVRGCVLDGNRSNVTSIDVVQRALITLGSNCHDVRIVDNELANCDCAFIRTGDYIVGGTGLYNIWVLNNYMHDGDGLGNQNGMRFAVVKHSFLIGNRVERSYDDNFAMISSFNDANAFCDNMVVAFNTFDSSTIASNIALTGHGHTCIGNIVTGSGATTGGVTAGAIRIRPSDDDGIGGVAKTLPWDITCSYNQVTPDPGGGGRAGIYVEGARCDVSHNMVFMPTDASVATKTNLIGIRSSTTTQALNRNRPTPSGMNRIEHNTVYGGYQGILHDPGSATCGRHRFRNNDVTLAYSHGIFIAPTTLAADDYLDVSNNYSASNGGDGIRLSGVWGEARLYDNVCRNNTGWGLNIPSGTQTRTRLRGNDYSNNTAGAQNVQIATALDSIRDRPTAVLAADLAPIASQTVFQDITGLGLAIGPSSTERWRVTWWLLVNAANTTMDLKLAFSVPTGCALRWGGAGLSTEIASWGARGTAQTPIALLATGENLLVGTFAGTFGVMVTALVTGGGTAGTVQPRYAQNTSDAGNLQILAGSVMEAVKVAS